MLEPSYPTKHFKGCQKAQLAVDFESDEDFGLESLQSQTTTNPGIIVGVPSVPKPQREANRSVSSIQIPESSYGDPNQRSSIHQLHTHSRFLYAMGLSVFEENEKGDLSATHSRPDPDGLPPVTTSQGKKYPIDRMLPVPAILEVDPVEEIGSQIPHPCVSGESEIEFDPDMEDGKQEDDANNITLPKDNFFDDGGSSKRSNFVAQFRTQVNKILATIRVNVVGDVVENSKPSSNLQPVLVQIVTSSSSGTQSKNTPLDEEDKVSETLGSLGATQSGQGELDSKMPNKASDSNHTIRNHEDSISNDSSVNNHIPNDDIVNKIAKLQKHMKFLKAIREGSIRGIEDVFDVNAIPYTVPELAGVSESSAASFINLPDTVAETGDWDEIYLNSDNESIPGSHISQDSSNSEDSVYYIPELDGSELHDENQFSAAESSPLANNDNSSSLWHLHTCVSLMYAIGLSSYGGNEHKCNIIFIIHMIGFVLINLFVFVDSLLNLKYFCLQFAIKQDLDFFVIIGYQIFHCLSAVYFVKFAAFDSKKISRLLDTLVERFANADANQTVDLSSTNNKVSRLAQFISISSLILAFLMTLFRGVTIEEVATAEPLLLRSYEVTSTVLLWNTNNYTGAANGISQEYGSNLTICNFGIGLLGFAMEFCGEIQHNAIRDLIMLATLTLHQVVCKFKTELQHLDSASPDQIDDKLRKFKHLQQISEKMTNALGVLLTFLHVKNILMFAYFFLQLLNRDNYDARLVLIAFQMTKTMVTYLVAATSARINQFFPTWIHKQRKDRTSRVGNMESNHAEMLLDFDELKREPVGMGSGMSFVSVAFVIKFLGYVATCFLFFAKPDK